MNNSNFFNYMEILSCEFEKEFTEIYKSLNVKHKTGILNYIPEIFNKWCASTMFEDTVLTPYIMIENLNNMRSKKNDLIFPVISNKTKNRFCGLNVNYIRYSIENHPIVSDIRLLLDALYPAIECDSDGFIKDEYCEKAFKVISIKSYSYLEYLFYLCIRTELLKNMPSLYTDMYAVNDAAKKEFSEKDNIAALSMLTDAAINIFTESINEFMPDDEVFIDREYVMQYIKKPHITDELISDIYNLLDIDINEIFSKDLSEIDEYDSMLLSTVYTLGTILDKSFLTPFSAYFHFIQPMFLMPLDLMREIDIILASKLKYEAVDLLLMPAHQYTLTSLAAKHFNIEFNDEYAELFEKMPVTYILENLDEGIESFRQVKSLSKPKIYAFRISCPQIKGAFLIELEENNTLSDLHRIICQAYSMSYFSDYSFYMSAEITPFSEYTPSAYKKIKHNKTENTVLNKIDFERIPNFFYCNYPAARPKKIEPTDCFNINFIGIHKNDTSFLYPRTIKYYK